MSRLLGSGSILAAGLLLPAVLAVSTALAQEVGRFGGALSLTTLLLLALGLVGCWRRATGDFA